MTYKDLTKKQKDIISRFNKHVLFINNNPFTKKQLNKIIELVACTYIYNVDMKTGNGYEQRLLRNIYYILTGCDNPEKER